MSETDETSTDLIDTREAEQQLVFIRRALDAADEVGQRQIIGEALLRFGPRFSGSLSYVVSIAEGDSQIQFQELLDLTIDIFVDWMTGTVLSDREDEIERRAAAALDILRNEDGAGRLVRIAAEALLELPKGHPRRDLGEIRSRLDAELAKRRGENEWEDAFLIAETLVRSEILDATETATLVGDLLREESVARDAGRETNLSDRAAFLRAASRDRYVRAVAAREDGTTDPQPLIDASVAFFEQARALVSNTEDDFYFAALLEEAGETERAADLLATSVNIHGEQAETAAWIEGLIRLRLGHYTRTIDVLAPLMDREERNYLHALEESEIEGTGHRFNKDAANLAFAYALTDRWAEALATIDRVKSPRLRHARRLRQTPEGQELLRLEAQLTSARRGAPITEADDVDREVDPLGARITRQARLLERYRSMRPDLATGNFSRPTLADLSDVLAPDEALVCLGTNFRGLMLGVILPGDRVAPSECMVIDDLSQERLIELCSGGEDPGGWLHEYESPQPVNPEPALAAMLDAVDEALGQPLGALLRKHGVRHASIVPHRLLHIIPFWALPSLRDIEVDVAASAAQWHDARKLVPDVPPRLAAVGNPTLDLGLAHVEAASVVWTLASRGFSTTLLLDRGATEEAMLASVDGAGVFHFAGHGLARTSQPLLSSLLAHPDERWGWPGTGDPLAKLAATATDWIDGDKQRYADLPDGRLVEKMDDDGNLIERLLEYAEQGTLFGSYDEGILLQLAELWTTADVLIEDAFSSCGIAYLAACESGKSALRFEIDEAVGLPVALQTAGAHTVISTLWPITDTAALLFARMFYRRLGAAPKGEFGVADAVRACRRELAQLSRHDATAMLTELRAHTTYRPSQARLKLAIEDLDEMGETPFAHPYHWAAYFSVGAEIVRLS
ncbi:MAG TPA: CHAT domain-containing protein [Gemmatimonadaceae bacterium]|jgi:CHAT domain-containing protein